MRHSPNNDAQTISNAYTADKLLGKTVYVKVPARAVAPHPREVGQPTGVSSVAFRVTKVDPQRNLLTVHSLEHWRRSECKLDAFVRYVKDGSLVLE